MAHVIAEPDPDVRTCRPSSFTTPRRLADGDGPRSGPKPPPAIDRPRPRASRRSADLSFAVSGNSRRLRFCRASNSKPRSTAAPLVGASISGRRNGVPPRPPFISEGDRHDRRREEFHPCFHVVCPGHTLTGTRFDFNLTVRAALVNTFICDLLPGGGNSIGTRVNPSNPARRHTLLASDRSAVSTIAAASVSSRLPANDAARHGFAKLGAKLQARTCPPTPIPSFLPSSAGHRKPQPSFGLRQPVYETAVRENPRNLRQLDTESRIDPRIGRNRRSRREVDRAMRQGVSTARIA